MREVCFLITKDERILQIYTGTATRIPDSRARWNFIWTYRDEIGEIAHTHPGGFLRFSAEDLTTMEAVESATDNEFHWSIVTRHSYLIRNGLKGDDRIYPIDLYDGPWWMEPLRELSFGIGCESDVKRNATRELIIK